MEALEGGGRGESGWKCPYLVPHGLRGSCRVQKFLGSTLRGSGGGWWSPSGLDRKKTNSQHSTWQLGAEDQDHAPGQYRITNGQGTR